MDQKILNILPENSQNLLINLIKLQVTKFIQRNLLHSLYTNSKRSERKIKETILFITASKITQYLRINLSKKAKDLHSENYKMLMKKSKMLQMERYSIFWDWKDQQCQNNCIAQIKPQIQCNPYPISNDIFHKIKTTKKSVYGETQKASNSQVNLEGEKNNWRNQAHWLQTIIQSYSHQNSQILAHKLKYRLIEEDRESQR